MTASVPSAPAGVNDSSDRSLLAAFAAHARDRGDRDAIRFLARGEAVTECCSYAALFAETEAIARGLVGRGLAGAPVVLAMAAGPRFAATFLGCLRAGAVAVTVPYPALGQNRVRFAAILADAMPAAAVTVDAERPPDLPDGTLHLSLDELVRDDTASLPPEPAADAPAMVQYSSGSTRAPRGVVVTHGNIAAAQRMLWAAARTGPDSVTVSWLPPFHDMGLMASILHPLFLGGTAVLMPPDAFLRQPLRWLRAISTHRATYAGAPNFGYELCVRRSGPTSSDDIDLTSLRTTFCGSEPVRAATLHSFAERFRGNGFDPRSLMACYGLAEATLPVAATPQGTGIREVEIGRLDSGNVPLSRVSCGHVVSGCTVVLRPTEPGGAPSAAPVGEICVAGPHVSPGTWGGATRTVLPYADAFTGASGERFLPTGDVGMLVDGELVIVDRIKDTIAIYGRKLHALDVEETVLGEKDANVVAAAAFSVPVDGREALAVLCELRAADLSAAAATDLPQRLRALVGDRHGAVPIVGILPYGALPRTSSGKIQRQRARALFAAGELRVTASSEREVAA